MGIDRLPIGLRLGLYGLAVAVLLYLCLAPSEGLPRVNLWDKAEHAIGWAVLTGSGLVLFPRQPLRVMAFSVAFGALIEVLQGLPVIHRDSDIKDWLADLVGAAVAYGLFRLLVPARRRR